MKKRSFAAFVPVFAVIAAVVLVAVYFGGGRSDALKQPGTTDVSRREPTELEAFLAYAAKGKYMQASREAAKLTDPDARVAAGAVISGHSGDFESFVTASVT